MNDHPDQPEEFTTISIRDFPATIVEELMQAHRVAERLPKSTASGAIRWAAKQWHEHLAREEKPCDSSD